MGFWERTWAERSEAVGLAFGGTAPPGEVYSFSWEDEIRCPGACAIAFPPVGASRDPIRHERPDWLYLTLGLSQPLDREQVERERAAGKSYSSHGIEFAFVVERESSLALFALKNFIEYQTDGEQIEWGHRFPFGFYLDENGERQSFTGPGWDHGFEPVGEIRAVLFWPLLHPDAVLQTSTGKFLILVATGITAAEWDFAKRTTSAHMLLLLVRAGIGQRTMPDRGCLLNEPRWQEVARFIEGMTPQECEAEIDTSIG